jgi:hypothetical protein
VWCDEIRRRTNSDCELCQGSVNMVKVKEDMYGSAGRTNAMVGHTLHFRYMVFRPREIGRFIQAGEE